MRVVDLDRDMSDVIPTGTTRDSEFLFGRMTDVSLSLLEAGPGRRVLDVASGVGQDALALGARGARVVGTEPSERMTGLARLHRERNGSSLGGWVRAWSDALPFHRGSFDAVLCKGSLDHFDRPAQAIAEMARVTAPDGRVVLAIANFESASCRLARAGDALREVWLRGTPRRGRRAHHVPSDHFTRYDLALMREQVEPHLRIDVVQGLSLGWGLPVWSRAVGWLPAVLAGALLRGLDALARRNPSLADVVVLAGRPHS